MIAKPQLDDWMGDVSVGLPGLCGWSLVWASVVSSLGLCTLGVHLIHLVGVSEGAVITLIGTVLPMILSVVLVVTGLWIYRRYPGEIVIWTGVWCVVAAVVLVAVSLTSIAYQSSKGVAMSDPHFLMANHATVGGVLGALMGVYDGQRHRRGRSLQRERDRAQVLSDQLSILNRVLRHDIRNCVNVIQGNATLIREQKVEADLAAESIYSKADELLVMSDKARHVKTLIEGETIVDTDVDIGTIVQAKTDELGSEYPAVEFETDVPESVVVRAPTQIEIAIEELLENAVKHNDADRPYVAVTVSAPNDRVQADGGGADVVSVQVHDNGPGIPQEQLTVIERGWETALDHMNGLGLWLVRWVVDAAGGEVTFERKGTRGSTVEIQLPADDGQR